MAEQQLLRAFDEESLGLPGVHDEEESDR